MDAALLFFGFLWALLGRGSGSSSAPTSSTSSPSVPSGTPPWPQVVPPDLPSFPGSAWEFDEPPPRAVQQRAGALVDVLWARGSGAYKTEQTDGRWVTYQAQVVRSGKKGVVAYRLKREKPPAPMAPPEAVARRAPAPPATAASWPAGPDNLGVKPIPANPLDPSLPTVRYGDGLKPAAPLPAVRLLQNRLGLLDTDGRFGKQTRAAVLAFQRQRGLDPDGIVGPKTWAALLSATSA